MYQVFSHALRAGARRVRLGLVPAGSGCASRHHEQRGQALTRHRRQACRDPAMIGTIDHRACAARKPEQRIESRQLAPASQQLLDAGIDDVRQVVAGTRRLDTRPGCDTARRPVITGNADKAAHQRCEPDAIARLVIAGDLFDGTG
jgi:hypothetical protein